MHEYALKSTDSNRPPGDRDWARLKGARNMGAEERNEPFFIFYGCNHPM